MPAELFGDKGVQPHDLAEPLGWCPAREKPSCLPELADVPREEGEQHGEVYAVRAAAGKEIHGAPHVARTDGIHERKDGDLGHLRERRAQIRLRELFAIGVERELFQLPIEKLQ